MVLEIIKAKELVNKSISETAVKEIPKNTVESVKSIGDAVLEKWKDIKDLTPEKLNEQAKEIPTQKQIENVKSIGDAVLEKWKDIKDFTLEKLNEQAKENITQKYERLLKGCLPRTDGEWDGEIGNSKWKPNPDSIPKKMNPENEPWKKIFDRYGIDSIEFKDGYPDFSEIAKGEVQIEDFTEDRSINFDQADEKLAKEWGCSPEEVEKWRKENKYTWHECEDCKTMQLVPSEVHGNIPHSGGISEYKKLQQ